ncbi:unnamed protein product [Clonostachys solani]|uniref:Uncharacterized protein n=1 Tax=Clonostachys solani TaxID=160281 RepID=A0A9N9ZB61_9HYPO|nr:unnamed protein product [Clonostachys solani]
MELCIAATDFALLITSVLLVGGHGKVAPLLTPLLLKRSWTVSSLIRTHDQVAAIQSLEIDQAWKLNILLRDIVEILLLKLVAELLHEVKLDYIV